MSPNNQFYGMFPYENDRTVLKFGVKVQKHLSCSI